jgi:hypothetical protein
MESFNEQPAEERQESQAEQKESGSFELYEFPPASGEMEQVQEPSMEDYLEGRVYPPPPSFYQQMQLPVARPLVAKEEAPRTPPLTPPPVRYAPAPGKMYPPPGTYPPGPYLRQIPPPSRRQNRAIALVIILSVLVLCSIGGWAFYSLYNALFQQINDATGAAQNFYTHMRSQDYAGAYQYLQIPGVSQNEFLQKAHANDTNYGTITNFTVETPSPMPGNSTSNGWNITVNLTREKASYPVALQIALVNGTWKITSIDLDKM